MLNLSIFGAANMTGQPVLSNCKHRKFIYRIVHNTECEVDFANWNKYRGPIFVDK